MLLNAHLSPIARYTASVLLTLVIVVTAACDGGDREPETTSTAPSSGQTTYRLDPFSTAFDLVEGNTLEVPVTLQRFESHVRPVTLSVRMVMPSLDDGLANASLVTSTLQGTSSDTAALISFSLQRQRNPGEQRQFVVRADDGLEVFEQTLVVNIKPSVLPDIYLIVGQSNAVGFSEDDAKDREPGGADAPDPRIQQLNVTGNDTVVFDSPARFSDASAQIAFPTLVPAEDPLHNSLDPSLGFKPGTRVGFALNFARAALRGDSEHRVLLVPAAWSSTGFCSTGDYLGQSPDAPDFVRDGELGWNVSPRQDDVFGGTTLFERAVLRANLAIEETNGILRGILWHQGESDGDNDICAAAYQANLQALASELRTRIVEDQRGSDARGPNSDVPFIVGTMSRGIDSRGDFSSLSDSKRIVDSVHRNAASLIPAAGTAVLDDLTPANGFDCGEGSCVHFGAAAQREMGIRYFQVLQNLLAVP